METKSPFLQKPVQENDYDLKKLFCKYLKNWHWFIFSIFVCFCLALVYIYTSAPIYKSTASILVRPDRSANLFSQLAVIEGYGYINNKNPDDEVIVLNSPTLMMEVINKLGIENTYYYKTRVKYVELYNQSPIKLILAENFRQTDQDVIKFIIRKTNNQYNISIKGSDFKRDLVVSDLQSPISTPYGEITFIERWSLTPDITYKVISKPKTSLIAEYNKKLKVSEQGSRSSIINLAIETTYAEKSSDILDKLLECYLENDIKHKKQNATEAIKSIDKRLKIVNDELIDVEKRIGQLNKQSQTAARDQELFETKRLYEAKEANFRFLMEKREENELRLITDTPEAQIISPAYISHMQTSPKKFFSMLLAVLIGIMIPIIVIYLLDLFNNRVENKKQLLNLLSVLFLGTVKTNKALRTPTSGSMASAEASFETIRNNLQYTLGEKKSPVILTASVTDGEGKTYIAMNLAASFASIYKKTVLIDMDTHHPSLAQYFNISESAKGWMDYIRNKDLKIDDIAVAFKGNTNLAVIPTGKSTGNMADIIMDGRLDELISELKKFYGYIIIDSTSINNNNDTYQLNRLTDNTVFVVRQNYTTYDSIGLINEVNSIGKLNNISVVLNATRK